MKNTIRPIRQELTIRFVPSAEALDQYFMTAISAISGDFGLVLQVSPNDVVRSTGMVAIPSGIITVNDVERVLEAATSLQCRDDVIMHASPTCQFVVDGSIRTKFMPIGMPAKRLDVTVALIRFNAGMLQRWLRWASASGRGLVGWRVEETL